MKTSIQILVLALGILVGATGCGPEMTAGAEIGTYEEPTGSSEHAVMNDAGKKIQRGVCQNGQEITCTNPSGRPCSKESFNKLCLELGYGPLVRVYELEIGGSEE